MSKVITSRFQDYSQWYNDLVIKGSLADYSAVRGCMVIKPYGYALWENMRDVLDKMFKDTGHQNAYFPLFVPKSLVEAEAKASNVPVGAFVRSLIAERHGYTLPPTQQGRARKYATAEERVAAQRAKQAERNALIKQLLAEYRTKATDSAPAESEPEA